MMITFVLSYITWFACSLGIGLLAERHFRTSRHIGELAFRGILVLSLIATAAHFFFPLAGFISAVFLILGIGGLVRERHQFLKILDGETAAISIPIIASASFSSLFIGYQYDVGLYQLQILKWNQLGPTPLGIANLFGALGNSSLWYPALSSLTQSWLGIESCFVPNSVLSAFFLIYLFERLNDLAKRGKVASNEFGLQFFFALTAPIIHRQLGATSSEHPALLFFLFWLSEEIRDDSEPSIGTAYWGILTAGFIMAVQPSLGLLAFGAIILSSRRLVLSLHTQSIRRTHVFISFGGFVALMGCFFLRGLFISGCFYFPLRSSCMSSLPWSVSRFLANYWATDFFRFETDPHWLTLLLRTDEVQRLTFLIIIAVVLCALGWIQNRKNSPTFSIKGYFPLLLTTVPGALFWLLTTRDLSHGLPYFLTFAGLFFAPCFVLFMSNRITFRYLPHGVAISSAILLLQVSYQGSGINRWKGWPNIETVETADRSAPGGGEFYVLDGRERLRCWAHQPPCAPPPLEAIKISTQPGKRTRIERVNQ